MRPLRKCNAPVKRPLVPFVPLDPLVLPIPRKPHPFPLAKPSSCPTGSPLSRSPALSPYYCAAVGFADGLTSQNVVGYTAKAAAETGNRYVTMSFVRVDGQAVDLQKDFQMDATVPTGAANIQLLDKDGFKTALYHWVKASDCANQPTPIPVVDGANGAWGIMDSYYDDEKEMDIVFYKPIESAVTFNAADAVQLFSTVGKIITFSGQVSDDDVTCTNATTGNFYIGNPFAAAIELADVQMDTTVPTGAANIQFLDKDGFKTALYHWVKAADCANQPTPIALKNPADAGAWGIMDSYYDDEEEMDVVFYKPIEGTISIGAGDAFQLFSTVGKITKIFSPYEL